MKREFHENHLSSDSSTFPKKCIYISSSSRKQVITDLLFVVNLNVICELQMELKLLYCILEQSFLLCEVTFMFLSVRRVQALNRRTCSGGVTKRQVEFHKFFLYFAIVNAPKVSHGIFDNGNL